LFSLRETLGPPATIGETDPLREMVLVRPALLRLMVEFADDPARNVSDAGEAAMW
jgi:hypothetical protein